MKKLKAFNKIFFSPDLPTDLVLFNIITITGFIGGITTIPFNILNGMSTILTAVIVVSIIIDGVCIYMANFRNYLKNSTIAVCFAVAIGLFPVMFFVTGGINSGMLCWFSMGIIFIFMLLDGMDFVFMLLTDVAIVSGCYAISYYHPEYIVNLESRQSVFFDVVQSLLICSFAIGSIIKFQRNIYDKLYKQAAINNDDLLEIPGIQPDCVNLLR